MNRLAATLRPGEQVQLLLKELAKAGSLPTRRIGVYHPTPAEHPDRCQHVETICGTCLPEWDNDYHVRRFEHGTVTAYRTIGCRCDECRAWAKRDHTSERAGGPS